MLNKITRVFSLVLGILYGLNAFYVFFFTSSGDEIRLFSIWETNKWIVGLVYLFFSSVFLSSEITKSRKKNKSTS
ncbi:hypothetical protein SAMN04488104_100283 [Algoriphagus faecimaris]|uniref:Uncharacterized protein n=1 Tax=Algoriphagus faecimaris TaxID=686796 RepID=A0A1G6MWU1_9BACT|nr:hypothetical protein [Algoriphagus faecimaris]SDC59395.1 hypothetical protein SAMN04488104_100283 [Algoriphagus faecimaris]